MKYLPNCFTVSMIEIGFCFDTAKKVNLWEVAMIEQIKQRDETMIIRLGFLEQI